MLTAVVAQQGCRREFAWFTVVRTIRNANHAIKSSRWLSKFPAASNHAILASTCDLLAMSRLKRQLESARGIIKVVANGESSDGSGTGANGNKRLRLGRAEGASRASALARYI